MSKKNIGLTIRRIMFVVFPLFSVACYSAPEWPARVAMMDGKVRDIFYEPAVKWQNTVSNLTSIFIDDKTEVAVADNDMSKGEQSLKIETQAIPLSSSINEEKQDNIDTTPKVETIKREPTITKEEDVKSTVPVDVEKENSDSVWKVNSILTVGDSLMSEIASGLRYGLDKGIKVKDIHKSSTGLTNSEYYDWPTVASNAVKQYQPDLVVIHMGGNDGQDMKIGKRFVHITDQEWQDTYYVRAMMLIKAIKKADPNAHIIWLGLPAMRDNKFAKKQDIIRSIQMKAALDSEVEYIDGKKGLGETYSKEGILDGKRVVIRRTDGIHYSREGGEILAHLIISDKKLELKWK